MALANKVNLNATTPAAPTGAQNIAWATDAGSPTANVSASDPVMVGDSGSGGKAGNVPAPAAGAAAAGKYLKADGTWAIPPGTGSGTFLEEVISFTGTSGAFSHAPARLFGLYRNGIRMTTLSGSPPIQTFSIAGGVNITLSVAAGGSDVFLAVYEY